MNREILFRGKRKDNNEWVYGDLIQLHDGRKYIIDNKFGACLDDRGNFINTESPFVNEVIPETICQYTGLKDKNGNKIFEGDICIGNGHIEKDDGKFIIKYGKYKTKDWKDKYISNTYQFGWYAEFIKSKWQVHLVIPNGIEVIGNIFDKKESE